MVHCVNVMLILFSFLLQLRSPGQLFTKRICYVMLGLVLSQKRISLELIVTVASSGRLKYYSGGELWRNRDLRVPQIYPL